MGANIENFKSIIKDDSTLINKDVDSGYSVSDMNLLMKSFAKEKNVDFVNWIDAVEKRQLRLDSNKGKAVSSVVYFYDKSLDWFTMLDFYAKGEIAEEFRLVVPVIVYPGKASGKESHYLVICFDFKPKLDTVDIILLEQHAMLDKTDENYDEKLDYSEFIDYYLAALGAYCKKRLGYTGVQVMRNQRPISRRKRVCGVVASEMARRVLSVKNPASLISSPLVLSDEDIDALHEKNKKIAETAVLKKASKDMQQKINTAKIQSQGNQMDY